MVMGFAMLKTSHAQNFNPNLSALLQFKLDSLVTVFQGNTKGVAVGVYCPGQGYWTGVSGISYPGVNLTTDMKQGIASNSKLFIAVTMLRMAEDQLLNLDSPINTWLPAIPNVDPAITVRQLLNHTSGVSDPFFTTPLLDSINANPTYAYTPAEILTWLGPPYFPVGTSYGYSNINYVLIGMIAESVSGLSMAQLVRNYILTPLSLDGTFYDISEPEIAPLAHRWHNFVDYNDTSRVSLNSAGGPAGSLFSTGDDMVHWYHALMDGQVLTQSSFNELTTFVSFGGLGNYGLGIQKSVFYNRETWGHGGSTHGYKSRCVYDPCNTFVVCGLSNDDWSAIDGITVLLYKALLDYLPDCSAAIVGETTVCQGQNGVTYTVNPIANATSYSWTLPNGSTGVSLTNSITLDYSLAALSGEISVKGVNMYGEGAPALLSVTVNPLPATPTISQNGNTLTSDAPNGNQWYDQSGILVGETNQNYVFTASGDYYSIVTLLGCNSSPSNTIQAVPAGVDEMSEPFHFYVYPNPVGDELTLEVQGGHAPARYSLTNVLNQEMMAGSMEQKLTIPTDRLTPGIYLIHLEFEGQEFVERIVKR